MAHCDPQMSDNANILPPRDNYVLMDWNLYEGRGANIGLGCSSNGKIAVCSIGYPPFPNQPTLAAFNKTGVIWDSSYFTGQVWYSAPLVDSEGRSIIADDEKIVRLYSNGSIMWNSSTPGGKPISPTLTKSGAVFIATSGGPVSVYNGESGRRKSVLYLEGVEERITGFYETINTPASFNDRVYVSTNFNPGNGVNLDLRRFGRLYAIDVIPQFNTTLNEYDYSLQVAWYFEFPGPSGASPLLIESINVPGVTGPVIYFDGLDFNLEGIDGLIFAIEDNGSYPHQVWSKRFTNSLGFQASFAKDPREEGGLWVIEIGQPNLIRLSENDGSILQTIDVDQLVGEFGDHRPSSAMTISGTNEKPIMIISALSTLPFSIYIISIDLTDERLVWKYRLDRILERDFPDDISAGQFPVIRTENNLSTVIFATFSGGVFALSEPVPVCGNGIISGGEQCDDGNTNNNDACTNQCKNNICGDGLLNFGVEQCDGSIPRGASCQSLGFISGTLSCVPPGRLSSCKFDTAKCSLCGNGVINRDKGETCDDGNLRRGDGCSSNCRREGGGAPGGKNQKSADNRQTLTA